MKYQVSAWVTAYYSVHIEQEFEADSMDEAEEMSHDPANWSDGIVDAAVDNATLDELNWDGLDNKDIVRIPDPATDKPGEMFKRILIKAHEQGHTSLVDTLTSSKGLVDIVEPLPHLSRRTYYEPTREDSEAYSKIYFEVRNEMEEERKPK
jgi:hypothetical protein